MIEVDVAESGGVEELGHKRFSLSLLVSGCGNGLAFGLEIMADRETRDWFWIEKVIIIGIVDYSSVRVIDDDIVCRKEGATKKNRSA